MNSKKKLFNILLKRVGIKNKEKKKNYIICLLLDLLDQKLRSI